MNGRDLHSLDAVERVRRVRERDSLSGLQQAIREVEESQGHLDAIESRLTELGRLSSQPRPRTSSRCARACSS